MAVRLSLRTKLLASFTLVLLPFLGLLVYGAREANERRIESILDSQMQTAQTVASLVDASFDEAFTLALALANDPIVQTLDPSKLDPHLERLAPGFPQFESFGVVNAAGDNVGISALFLPGTKREGMAADRPYFQQLMATGEPVVSEMIISQVTFRPTLVMGVPLRDREGELIGAVLVSFYLKAFSDRLAEVAIYPEQVIFLVDRGGTVALHTALPDLPRVQRNVGDFEPVRAALEGRPTRVRRFLSPLLGDFRLGAFTATPKYGWVVVITIREDVAQAPVSTALRDQLLGFGAVAAVTVGIALILSNALLQPIRRLSDHALALGRGELFRRVEIKTGDEMEALGATFNQMADRLARALGDLRAIIDATESGIVMYDPDFTIRLVNQPMVEWFQLDPATAIGQPVDRITRELILPKLANPDRLLAHLDRLRPHPGEEIWEELEQVRPVYRVLRLYIGPVGADQAPIGYLDVYTDITELRRREAEQKALGEVAEALVRERNLEQVADIAAEQGQRVLRTHTIGLFLVDREREQLRLIAQRGYSAETVAEIGVLPLTSSYLTALGARTGQPQEVPDVHGLGPELADARRVAEREGQRSIFSQPLFARERLVGVLTLAKPVPHRFTPWERDFVEAFADQIAVAVENARLYDDLQETLHLRDEFLSVAAHELKTPVAALLGYVQLLLRSTAPRTPEERHSLQAIERQIKRITHLSADMLETVSPSVRPLQLQAFDLVALAEQVVDEVAQLSERHRPILCWAGPLAVEADKNLVRRVLTTLLDNAIRFSPEGGRVEVTATTEEGMALVSVRDYGLGIPKERGRYIFEPFYEPYPAGTPGYAGTTGLSLYIARRIIARHGGRIWFTSEEGKGSTFFFTLPLAG